MDKNISDTWSLLGSLSHLEHNDHNAVDKYLHAVEVKPHQSNYWLNLTMGLIGLEYYDQAMECVETSIKLLSNNSGRFDYIAKS